MKLRNKIILTTAPLAAVATTLPVVMTSCSKEGEIGIYNKEGTYSIASKTTDKFIFHFDAAHQFKQSEAKLYKFVVTFKNVKVNNVAQSENILDVANFSWTNEEGVTTVYDGCAIGFKATYTGIKATDKITFDVVSQIVKKDSESSTEYKDFSNKITLTGFTITVAA